MMFFDRVVVRSVLAMSLAVFALTASQPAGAAGYPDRSVRIVVPFGPGGIADTTARIIAEKLGDKLGQRFYVENQPGAGGIAAARTVISSPPDGYTLALLSNGTAISVSLFKSRSAEGFQPRFPAWGS
jgi:tripartite-type tricarboxylate transporter receptor subunit TctC